MSQTHLPELDALVEIIKTTAVRELKSRFARIQQHFKSDGSIITEADSAMQEALQLALSVQWPSIAFLGEEMSATEQEKILRESQNGVWIVDPLDGTSNYSVGIPCYAVSVALVINGGIELGVVYDPERDECFFAQRGHGARLNGAVLNLESMRDVDRLTIGVVDLKRLTPELAARLATRPPYKSQRSFGSVALDWCWMAAGRGEVYVHGKQKLWDYAAGLVILEEAGGIASTLQGEPVYNGTLTPRSAVLAINQGLFDKWLAYLRDEA